MYKFLCKKAIGIKNTYFITNEIFRIRNLVFIAKDILNKNSYDKAISL